MLTLVWRLTRGYRLTPWRSPYLKWRMETYWGFHADQIAFTDFCRFAWERRADLWRYLRWASRRGHLRGADTPVCRAETRLGASSDTPR